MVEWFYGKDGQQHGPVDEATLRARVEAGEVKPTDLVWCEGMETWRPFSEVLGPVGPEAGTSSAPASEDLSPFEGPSPYAPPLSSPDGSMYRPGPGVAVTNGCAIASLICGILSLVFFCLCGGILFGIPAVICGHLALSQLNHPDNRQQGRGMAVAGLVCGYCGLAIFGFFLLSGDTSVQFNGTDW